MAIEKVGFVHLTFDSFYHPWIMYGIRMKLQKEQDFKKYMTTRIFSISIYLRI